MIDALAKVNQVVLNCKRLAQAICFLLILIIFFITIVARLVFMSDFPGMEEIVMLLAVWLYMFGAALGTYDDTHISADLISTLIKSPRGKAVHKLYVFIVNALIAGYFLNLSWTWFQFNLQMNPLSTVWRFPMVIAYASILFGFFFVFIYTIMHLIVTIQRLVTGNFTLPAVAVSQEFTEKAEA
jgi:TRAP-type C4-dicarboxylate transport system, small permease component